MENKTDEQKISPYDPIYEGILYGSPISDRLIELGAEESPNLIQAERLVMRLIETNNQIFLKTIPESLLEKLPEKIQRRVKYEIIEYLRQWDIRLKELKETLDGLEKAKFVSAETLRLQFTV